MKKQNISPDYLFETSWEVCNKVGGIHTVISTKAPLLVEEFGDRYIAIGPDVWKETERHPEFIESEVLFTSWRDKARADGLNIRIGRWDIPGSPVAILVDFTPYFTKKNEVFAWLWETYKVDSITGQWDYIEPALFGYATALVIESFYEYYASARDQIVAQYHEWMTGAGVLYLKDKVPQVATVFTTHATILGRSISSNGMALYSGMEKLDNDGLARTFGIISKYSLEKNAAQEADVFTTVSSITAKECDLFLGRQPDVITVNGFDDSFLPQEDKRQKKRSAAREKLFTVAEALLGRRLSRKSILVINSGRYEFRNKGIDLFIRALGTLNKELKDAPEIIAFITVPAHHTGVNQELMKALQGKDNHSGEPKNRFTTHELNDPGKDPVLKAAGENGLNNRKDDRVSLIFVPAYLNNKDGIFNMSYYDLLTGFDISAFPSYYEPWGYTPLESAAFRIPTITTSLAGFGQWAKNKFGAHGSGVYVIERTEHNEQQVVSEMAGHILEFRSFSSAKKSELRKKSFGVSRSALWKELIAHYFEAYSQALERVTGRSELFHDKTQSKEYFLKDISLEPKPTWKRVFIEPSISGKLEKLQALSRNIWWVWNYRAEELFWYVDPEAWEKHQHNPVSMLESVSFERIKELESDEEFLEKLNHVYAEFEAYMDAVKDRPEEVIAYFSMEYGLHDSIKIFSGGLGMLAGDYLKEASDSNKNMVAVGLIYRYGYFKQQITLFGDQVASYTPQKFTHLPLIPVRDEEGDWVKVSIALPGRNLNAKAWKVNVGRITLYLLDADITDNLPDDRIVTHQLYGGSWENRFKQELLLGVGGIRLLKKLGIEADVYHLNEGHAAFAGLERLRLLVQEERLSFDQAVEVVRAGSLFTTHTPVPAGHDAFAEDILRTYIPHYADRLNISWERFLSLGRALENNPKDKFSMSILAMNLSKYVNGVSKIHGRVSREMFSNLYPGYFPSELHIGHVTNGVHYPFWTGKEWQKRYLEEFGHDFIFDQSNQKYWRKIHKVTDQKIWELRNIYRGKLIKYLKNRLERELTDRQENPKLIFQVLDALNPSALTIGFARRFATYKRAHLLFSNIERLRDLVSDPERPVQFIFAGKAHPADKAGQDLIKRIIEISKTPPFIGRIIFVENYDIRLAKKLLQGVDVWMNTPTRPLEASGTSGEKALMNGVLNLSVLDGWWAEGYKPGAGWAIKEARTYGNQQFQDELDAETIYQLLEDDIITEFYNRRNDIPSKWVKYIKNSIAEIAPHFTMKRMLDDYYEKYYHHIVKHHRQILADHFEGARELDAWKSKVKDAWEGIRVSRIAVPDSSRKPLQLGDNFVSEVEVELNGLKAEDIGMDIIVGQKEEDVVKDIVMTQIMDRISINGNRALFRCNIPTTRVGVYDYAFRIFPTHPLLQHRQDFSLIKWV